MRVLPKARRIELFDPTEVPDTGHTISLVITIANKVLDTSRAHHTLSGHHSTEVLKLFDPMETRPASLEGWVPRRPRPALDVRQWLEWLEDDAAAAGHWPPRAPTRRHPAHATRLLTCISLTAYR